MHTPIEAAGVAPHEGRAAPFDFENVFRAQYDPVTRVIARVIQDPARAEELAVEAFWRLWKTSGAQGERATAWLRRTAVRLALDELRRRARRARYEALYRFLGSAPQADELFSAAQEEGCVRAVLAALTRRDAELLLLRSDGYSYDELARDLGLKPASVGTLLNRARQAFRKEYVRRYGEPTR